MSISTVFLQVSNNTATTAQDTGSSPDFWVNIILVLAVIASIGVSIYYNSKSHKQTNRQLELTETQLEITKKEIEHRFKSSLNISYLQTNLYHDRQEDPPDLDINLTLENAGTINATNIRLYSKYTNKEITLDTILEKNFLESIKSNETIINGSIPSSQKRRKILFSHNKLNEYSIDTSKIILYIIYDDEENKDHKFIQIISFSYNDDHKFLEYYDEYDIKKSLRKNEY